MEISQQETILFEITSILLSIFILIHLGQALERLGTNRNNSIFARRMGFTIFILLSFISGFIGNQILNLMVLFIAFPLIGYLFYNREKGYILRYIVLVLAIIITEFLVTLITNYLLLLIGNPYSHMIYLQLLHLITMRLCEVIVLKMILWIMNRTKAGYLTILQFISSLLFPAFSIFFVYSLLYLLQLYTGVWQLRLFLLNVLLILGLNFYFSWVFNAITRNNQMKTELLQYQQQSEYQYEYYQRLERQYQESRKIIHDIRNHLLTMEQLIQLQDTTLFSQYSADVHGMLNRLGMKYYTDNRVLNIILNDKFVQMQDHEIETRIRIGEFPIEFMKAIDITTIFANLLDNAMEAAGKSTHPFVEVYGDRVNDFLTVTISNSTIASPKSVNGFFLSSKAKHEGIGIKNVAHTLSQYHGDIQQECHAKKEEFVFVTKLMIPIP